MLVETASIVMVLHGTNRYTLMLYARVGKIRDRTVGCPHKGVEFRRSVLITMVVAFARVCSCKPMPPVQVMS
ncbi:hypothetical protein D3C81_1613190 [compost metagenome]